MEIKNYSFTADPTYTTMPSKVFESLASSLGRPDEQPNIELAIKIAKSGNVAHVAELIELLSHSKTAVRHDAIKVLYEN